MSDDNTKRLSQRTREKPRIEDDEALSNSSREIMQALGAVPSKRIGPYWILHEIGRGSYGVVYRGVLKQEGGFQQTVAIKVARRVDASEQDLWRFRQEQKLLSALNHEGIARFLQGGETDDGDPWIAMEYVEGQPIDTYCRQHRLNIQDRIRLFLDACEAVQFAHRNSVVHRDLKPAHILVSRDPISSEPKVKLLDFGIAKVLNPDQWGVLDATRPGAAPQTPQYAAPEQILRDEGQPINTLTDVYALGVILHDLLTGHHPHRIQARTPAEYSQKLAALMRAHVDPARPSDAFSPPMTRITTEAAELRGGRPETLRRQLAGDLDTIVLKALAREQDRRYQSVDELTRDLRHHMRDEPIEARPATITYRVSKWARRHKGWVAVTLLTAVVIGLAIGVVLMEVNQRAATRTARAKQATLERQIDQSLDRATTLVDSLLGGLYEEVDRLTASDAAKQRLVELAKVEIEELQRTSPDDPRITLVFAQAQNRIGEIEADLEHEFENAIERHNEARNLLLSIRGSSVGSDTERDLVRTNMLIGDCRRKLDDLDAARAAYVEALQGARMAAGTQAPKDKRLLALALVKHGLGHKMFGDFDEAEQSYVEAQDILTGLEDRWPEPNEIALDLARTFDYMADIHESRVDAIVQAIAPGEGAAPEQQAVIATAWSRAIQLQQEAVWRYKQVYADADTFAAAYDLWKANLLLTDYLDRGGGSVQDRQELYRVLIELALAIGRNNPRSDTALMVAYLTQFRIARLHELSGDTDEAREQLAAYRQLLRNRLAASPGSIRIQRYLANNDLQMACVLMQAAAWDEAIKTLDETIHSVTLLEHVAERDVLDIRIDLVELRRYRIDAYVGAGLRRQACDKSRSVLRAIEELLVEVPGHEHVVDLQRALVRVREDLDCEE